MVVESVSCCHRHGRTHTRACVCLQYANFVETWALFDPEATGFLEWHVLPDFLAELEPPMGLGKNPMPTSKELMCLIGAY